MTGGAMTLSVNWRLCAKPSLRLVNQTVPTKLPTARLLAAALRLNVTVVAGPPTGMVPLVGETVSHAEVLMSDHGTAFVPKVINE